MSISEYIFAILLVANVGALVGHGRRFQDVERKLNLVLAHLGIDPKAQVNQRSGGCYRWDCKRVRQSRRLTVGSIHRDVPWNG